MRLATLLLSIIFILSIFVLGQFFLSQEVTGKDEALTRLNSQIEELSQLLALERTSGRGLRDQLAVLTDSFSQVGASRRASWRACSSAAQADAKNATTTGGQVADLQNKVDSQKRISDQALAQVELLNQQISALRRQIGALEQALDASESRDRESQTKIADLGSRLNVALAQRVQELSRFRSDFFGRLREILGNRPDVRIVGDRFVFQSEVFFAPGQATLQPEGRSEMDKLATALLELQSKIPARHSLGAARRRPHRQPADQLAPVPVELGAFGEPRDLRRAISHLEGNPRPAPGGRGLRRVPADRPDGHRRCPQPQPSHRTEADGAVTIRAGK